MKKEKRWRTDRKQLADSAGLELINTYGTLVHILQHSVQSLFKKHRLHFYRSLMLSFVKKVNIALWICHQGVTAPWDFDIVASLQSTKRRKASQVCVRLKYTWILSFLQRIPTTFGPIWWGVTHKRWPYQSTATQRLSQASSTRSPRKPSGPRWYLWRRSWEHPEWCQRTPFYGGLVYTERVLRKHIHTHTHAHIAANTNKHADADWDRLGQRAPPLHPPNPFLPTGRTGDVGRTHAEPTVYVQEAACAPSFQTRCSATVIGSWCISAMNRNNRHSAPKLLWLTSLTRTIKNPNFILLTSKIWEQPQKSWPVLE